MKLLYVDLFCGAGGVTTGVSQVPGVYVVACVNHDANAIASHEANHPGTLHFTEDIRTLDTAPLVERLNDMRRRFPDAKVVLWASCECTNFSRAKGGKPRDPDSRSLAEHLYRYIEALRPDYVQVENVVEFLEWGPMAADENGRLMPDRARRGESFRAWVACVEGMGFCCEWRVFNAADFGAYTSRKRLFVQFARDGFEVVWPVATRSRDCWRACRDVLDLDDYGQSIFARRKPLVDATLRRLAEGIRKFVRPQFVLRYMSGSGHVHSTDAPCVALCTQKNVYLASCVKFMDNYFGRGVATGVDVPCGALCTKEQRFPVTAVFVASYYSGGGQVTGTGDLFPTLLTVPKQRLVHCTFVDQQYGQSGPASLDGVFPAITTNLHHSVVSMSYVRAMMRPGVKGLVYSVDDPMRTLLTRDYFYLDTCVFSGVPDRSRPEDGDSEMMLELKSLMRERGIADVYMRPVSVRESLRIMGFPADYKLVGTQTEKRKFIGNAVEVNMARCLAEALVCGLAVKERRMAV